MGVILHAMLVGRLPFRDGGRLRQLLRERMQPLQLPTHLSAECCDLVRAMLTYDPARRFTLDDVLSHPWMMQSPR